MFSRFEFKIALRYLKSKRKEGFISVISSFSLLGISLGVATLIIVMAVMNGFREELLSRMIGLNGQVGIYGINSSLVLDTNDAVSKILKVNDVSAAVPKIDGQVMMRTPNFTQGVMIRGLSFEDIEKSKIIKDGISGDTDLTRFKDGKILIGNKLASRAGLWLNDEITLIAPSGHVTAFGTMPRLKSYIIGGFFDVNMYEYDANYIIMPINEARKFMGYKDKESSSVEVFTNSFDDTDKLKLKLAKELGGKYHIQDWLQANESFFNAIKVERNVMFLILTLIILVAAFNIISGLIMLVYDKSKGIAILRTIGASKGSLMRIFFICGSFIGIVGTSLGVLLGLLFCLNIEEIRLFLQNLTGTDLFSAEIYFLSRLPAKIDFIEVFWVVVMALGLSFSATIYPAYKASKMDPVEALRYE
jgi:lipoprotein-releasing system permease protein